MVKTSGTYRTPDIGVKHVFVRTIKPIVDGAAGISVCIESMPLPKIIAILAYHQRPPSAVEPALIVVFCHIKFHRCTVLFDLNDAANRLTAQSCCHNPFLPPSKFHPGIGLVPHPGDLQAGEGLKPHRKGVAGDVGAIF